MEDLLLDLKMAESETPYVPSDDLRSSILIVDDNPESNTNIERYLSHNGFKVLVCARGEHGLQRVVYARPDLILLDVMVPDVSGYELCRRLKQNPKTKDIPVIFMTNPSESSDIIRCFKEGGVDCLRKPVHLEEALARIRTQLSAVQRITFLQRQNRIFREEIKKRSKSGDILKCHIHSSGEGRGYRRLDTGNSSDDGHTHPFEKLKKKEMQYRTLLENANEAIAVVQDDMCCFFNPKAAELFSDGMGVLTRKPFEMFIHSEDRQRFTEIHQKRLKGKEAPERYTLRIIDGRGEVKWGEVKCVRIPWNEKDAILYFITDISDRKRSEKILRDSHHTLTTVLDSIDALIYTADLDNYKILFANRKMMEKFGSDITGKFCWNVLMKKELPCTHCINKRLLDEPACSREPVIWEDYNERFGGWFVNYVRIIKWLDGRMVHLHVSVDISDIKRLEEKRRETEMQLRRAQKMEAIGTLAGGIAHDFNNILFPIFGHMEMLKEDIESESPLQESIDEIFSAALRAKELVQQILTFSRKSEETLAPVALPAIIREVLKLIRSSIPVNIEIDQMIDETCGMIMGDASHIHQIMMNLIINAYHALEENTGRIGVRLGSVILDSADIPGREVMPGSYARIEVEDNGMGMSPEIMDRIFDPYFTTKKKDKGTGLGLSVVHGLIQSYKGYITVKSARGEGTLFQIYIPLLPEG